jgi:hypothetical protein
LTARFNPSALGTACGPFCDPQDRSPVTFFSGSQPAAGVQVLDFSQYSSKVPTAEQLLTEPSSPVQAGNNPNWFENSFAGVLGLHTDWKELLEDDPQRADEGERLELSRNRTSCRDADRTSWLPSSDEHTPSCRDDTRGDWIETVEPLGVNSVDDAMRAFIAREGSTFPYSGAVVPTGPNAGNPYGKGVVVWLYLWDCAQKFEGEEWEEPDCSNNISSEDADRVHLFTVIPFTFYEGLVTDRAVQAYWGGGFVEGGRCQSERSSCPLVGPLANTAFLIAEEDSRFTVASSGGGGNNGGGGGGGGGDDDDDDDDDGDDDDDDEDDDDDDGDDDDDDD